LRARISEIDRPVNLLSRRESRNDRLGKKWFTKLLKLSAYPSKKSAKEKPVPENPWQAGEARLARSAEIESSARMLDCA